MSDVVVDKLIFALAGDYKDLDAAYAHVDQGADKLGKSVKEKVGGGFKDAASAATQSTTQLKNTLGEVEKQVTKTHGATATATREFRALFDELTSGRTRQTPGTLAIIATRVFGISGATLLWGAALAAIPAGLAYAAVQAENMASRVQRALEVTGYAAGVTRDQILGIGNALDQTTRLSQRGGMDIATILAGRGNVGSANLQGATKAAFGLSIASSTSEDKAAAELEKILSDPAKGAAELNAQFKLLDVAQVEQIKNLQASGDTAKAQKIIIDALNERFGALEESSWSLAKAFDSTGKFLSDFWNHTGQLLTGTGKSKPEQLAALEGQYASAQASAAAIKAGTFEGAGGGANRVYAALKDLPPQIEALKNAIAADEAKRKAGETRAQTNAAIGAGLEDAYKGAGDYQKRKQDAQNELNRDQLAVRLATDAGSEYVDTLTRQRDAMVKVVAAIKEFGDPAVEARTRAGEQARINAAKPEDRARITAEVQAARTLRTNLQSPTSALTAQATFESQMAEADAADRYNNKAETLATRQANNLAAAQAQAIAEENLAAAYDSGAAAVARLKAVGEAHAALVKHEISDEDAYAEALMRRAFATERVKTAQQSIQNAMTLAGLERVGAAGGNPIATREAEVQNKALEELRGEFENAVTMADHMQAYQDLKRREGEIRGQDQQGDTNALKGDVFGAQQTYGRTQQTAAAIAGGATDDDLRRLEVAQKTFDDLVRRGIDPTIPANQQLYDELLKVNEQTSDLTDAMTKLRQEAKEFASDITGPIKQELTHGGNIMDMFDNIGQNMLDTAVQHHIIDPLQKQLEGVFGDILGGDMTAPDGSQSAPYYVKFADAIPGAGGSGGPLNGDYGGGGGGLGDILGGIFGGGKQSGGEPNFLDSLFGGSSPISDAAGNVLSYNYTDASVVGDAAASSGDWLSSLLDGFMGLFDDGGTIGPGQWGVKSGMPEIIQGGTGGVSVMPLTAPRITAALGSPASAGSPSGSPGMGGGSNRGGDTFHFHLPGVQNPQDFFQSRSQIESQVSKMAARGRRNQ